MEMTEPYISRRNEWCDLLESDRFKQGYGINKSGSQDDLHYCTFGLALYELDYGYDCFGLSCSEIYNIVDMNDNLGLSFPQIAAEIRGGKL